MTYEFIFLSGFPTEAKQQKNVNTTERNVIYGVSSISALDDVFIFGHSRGKAKESN